MSYSQQSGKAKNSQGLMPEQRSYFSGQAPRLFGEAEGFARQAASDPGGLGFLNIIDNSLLPTGKYGLPTAATEGVYQLGRDLFTQASGSRAQRGFNTSANLEGVLGDAVRMASGQLIPMSTQVALERAKMAPQLQQARFGYQMTPMQTLQQLLSGSGQGQSSSSGFGFNAGELVKPAAAALTASDRRLKSNIIRIGTHPLNIGWYEYTIDGHREQGVMADEVLQVKPEAVVTRSDGYLMVNYGLIGKLCR